GPCTPCATTLPDGGAPRSPHFGVELRFPHPGVPPVRYAKPGPAGRGRNGSGREDAPRGRPHIPDPCLPADRSLHGSAPVLPGVGPPGDRSRLERPWVRVCCPLFPRTSFCTSCPLRHGNGYARRRTYPSWTCLSQLR